MDKSNNESKISAIYVIRNILVEKNILKNCQSKLDIKGIKKPLEIKRLPNAAMNLTITFQKEIQIKYYDNQTNN